MDGGKVDLPSTPDTNQPCPKCEVPLNETDLEAGYCTQCGTVLWDVLEREPFRDILSTILKARSKARARENR